MKLKTFLSIFLVVLFLPIAGYAFAPETESIKNNDLFQENYALLRNINAIKDTSISEDTEALTRAEFVSLVVDAANIDSYKEIEESQFVDVLQTHKYFNDIHVALEYGYISSGSYFMPDDEITLEQASAILLRALGYTLVAESEGGYPNGYKKTAHSLFLYDNVDMSDNKISFSEAITLIFNFLNAELLDVNITGSGLNFEKTSNKTLLTQRYNLLITTGIINANKYTDLLATNSSIFEGEIKINDIVFKDPYSLAYDYLGYHSKVYYKVDKVEKTNIIMHVELGNKNRIKKIDVRDLLDCSLNVITYNTETNKKEEIKTSGITFIVNGRMKLITPQELKSIKKGELTFISNDGDTNYDVCIVSDYRTTIVTGISPTEQVIICDNGEKIDFNDQDFDNVIVKNGSEINFHDLKVDNVLMISESEGQGKNLRTILVSDTILNGTIDSIYKDKIEVAGVSYSYDSDVEGNVKVGNYYKIYLDYNQNICFTSIKTDIVYGYLYDSKRNSGLEPSSELRIFTENNREVILKLREKVNVNGNTVESFKLVNKNDSINYLEPKQLIRYKVNSNAEITFIETASTIEIGTEGEEQAISDSKFRISFEGTSTWRSSSKTFEGKFYADKTTKIFLIPDVNDISTFDIRDISALSGDKEYTNIVAYDADEFHNVKVIMFKELPRKINHNSKFMIVTDKIQMLNSKEDVVTGLVGYWSGDQMIFPVKISEKLTESQISALTSGDLILFTYDDLGNIDEIKTYKSDPEHQFFMESGIYSYFNVVGGEVSKIDYATEKIAINYLGKDVNTAYSDYCLVYNNKTAIYIYNSKTNAYQIASADDILPGDRVCMNISYLVCKEIIVLR